MGVKFFGKMGNDEMVLEVDELFVWEFLSGVEEMVLVLDVLVVCFDFCFMVSVNFC